MDFPLDKLSPDDFEKLAFYLLDDMGFKNLEWRKGGEGVSATDGGRDLSAKYAKMELDDSIVVETWWIEVKHRSRKLSKSTIQSIILNSTARRGVDVFAIFTNNVLSNPTLDWIKDFQDTYAKPRIVVWQKHDIERILRKYPGTVALFFPESLSLPKQLESIKERFWNQLHYPTINEIEKLWANYHSLDWNSSNLFPVIVAESALEGINVRKWGLVIDEKLLIETLRFGLINVPFLVKKLEQLGHSQKILTKGLEYLLQSALLRLELDSVVEFLLNTYKYTDTPEPPPELLKFIISPVIHNSYTTLVRNCTIDCKRFNINQAAHTTTPSYFDKFSSNLKQEVDDQEPFVLISLNTEKCKLDLVPIGLGCPLTKNIPENIMDKHILTEYLGTIQSVIRKRVAHILNS